MNVNDKYLKLLEEHSSLLKELSEAYGKISEMEKQAEQQPSVSGKQGHVVVEAGNLKEYLIKSYNSGVSGYKLAKELGCTTATMYKILRECGVSIRPRNGRNNLVFKGKQAALFE